MKQKLKGGGFARLHHAVFKTGTDELVARWDPRKDKVIATARRLMRANNKLKLEVRSKWFVTPPRETLPVATPPAGNSPGESENLLPAPISEVAS